MPAALLLALGVLLRLAALRGDFWLDEIWSYDIARSLASPLQILTSVHVDNNHYLNTFFLWLVGEGAAWEVYRLPALVAGSAAMAFAWLLMRRHGEVEALIALGLFAVSYPMIHYSSEARGYAMATATALASYAAARRLAAGGRGAGWAVAFSLLLCLGLLTHLIFFLVLLAYAPWAVARVWRSERRLRTALTLALALLPPAAFAGWLFQTSVSKMLIGGGPDESLLDGLIYTLSFAAGGPESGAPAALVSVAALALIVGGIAVLARQQPSDGVFWAAVIAIPAAAFLWRRADFVHPRYFIVSLTFAILAASLALGRLWRRGGAGRWCAAALLALAVGGNAVHLVRFFALGRGAYEESVRYMLDHSPGPMVTVSGDHSFRNRLTLQFYLERLGARGRLVYFEAGNVPPEGTEWMLLHRFDDLPIVSEVKDRHGNRYRLQKRARFYGFSGWCWHVYARAPGAAQARPR